MKMMQGGTRLSFTVAAALLLFTICCTTSVAAADATLRSALEQKLQLKSTANPDTVCYQGPYSSVSTERVSFGMDPNGLNPCKGLGTCGNPSTVIKYSAGDGQITCYLPGDASGAQENSVAQDDINQVEEDKTLLGYKMSDLEECYRGPTPTSFNGVCRNKGTCGDVRDLSNSEGNQIVCYVVKAGAKPAGSSSSSHSETSSSETSSSKTSSSQSSSKSSSSAAQLNTVPSPTVAPTPSSASTNQAMWKSSMILVGITMMLTSF